MARVKTDPEFATALPDEAVTLCIPAVGSPSEIDWRGDEVVLLTMKSQDTEAALLALRASAGDVSAKASADSYHHASAAIGDSLFCI